MKLIIAFFLLPLISIGQKGEISGSVFYKYNDYVGNRPDAGSSIRMVPLNDPEAKKTTLVNLSGDFHFTLLDTGSYLLIIKSKETNSSPYMGITRLIVYGNLLNKYFGFNPRSLNKPLQASIELKNKEYTDYLMTKNPKPKRINSLRDELDQLSFKFFSELPIEGLIKAGISLPTEKIEIREVTISVKPTEILIIDFGLTYRN